MTHILIVISLVTNLISTIVTNETGKTQIEQSSEFIIIDDFNM